MATKRYRVCVPREYLKDGEKKTHFWQVGVGWPLKERDGATLELYTRVLPGNKLVLLVDEPREGTAEPEAPLEDDVPF